MKPKNRKLVGALAGAGALLVAGTAFGGTAPKRATKPKRKTPGNDKPSGTGKPSGSDKPGGGGGTTTGGDKPGSGSSDNGGGTSTGGGSGEVRWTPGSQGQGRIYGPTEDRTKWPPDFDFGTNMIWISPDCDIVLQGRFFLPPTELSFYSAIEPTENKKYVPGQEVAAVLAIDPQNTIAGYVDWAMENGFPTPAGAFVEWAFAQYDAAGAGTPSDTVLGIAGEVLRQLSPMCVEVDPEQHWGTGLAQWMTDFLGWIEQYLIENWSWQIDFNPERSGDDE